MKKLALFFTILTLLTCAVSAELPLDAPAEIAETHTAADVFLSVFEHDGSDFVYPEEYAGHWTDGEWFHIALTDVSEETLTKYLGWMQDYAAKTIFHEARYSYAGLKEGAAYYIHELGNHVGNIVGHRIIPMLNCIVLEHVGDREPIEEALEAVGAPEGMFSIGQGTTVCPMPEIVPPAVVPGGSQIYAIEAYQLLEQSFDIAYGGYPDHYSGCWLDGGALHIGVTTDDEGTLSVYRDILAPAVCEIVYDVQPYGYNQLMSLHDAISEKLNTDGNPYELSSWGVDVSGCRIVVESRIGYTDGLYNALAALAAELGMGEDAFHLEEYAVEIVVQTDEGIIEEHIVEEPAVEVVTEEIPVTEATSASEKITDFYFNPLEEHFFAEYGDGVYPDDYAGCWFSNRFDMHIMLTEDVTEENRLKYIDLAGRGHIGIISVETAVFSMNELNCALAEVKSAFGDEYGIGKVHGIINEAENRIDLDVNFMNDDREAILEDIASDLSEADSTRLFAVYEPVAEEISVTAEPLDCPGPPDGFAPMTVSSNPLISYFKEKHGGFPDYYSGHRYSFGELTVYITEGTVEAVYDIIRSVCGEDTAIETRRYSYSQLTAALDGIVEKSGGKVWGGIDIYMNRVVLYTCEPLDEIRIMYKEIFVSLGADEDIFDLHASTYPDTTAELVIVESGKPVDAAAMLLDAWFAEQRNFPADYLGYEKDYENNTIIVKINKNDEETFDKFRSITAAADCEITFEIVPQRYATLDVYKAILAKHITTDENPYNFYACGISTDEKGFIYLLREHDSVQYGELTAYVENILQSDSHFTDCTVKICEYMSDPEWFFYLRTDMDEIFFEGESEEVVAIDEPTYSPATGDPTTVLCLLLSMTASACIFLTKRR